MCCFWQIFLRLFAKHEFFANYNLYPAHFYTSPGFAWQAVLKSANVTLDLFTENDMYLIIELGIRGGVAMIINRYAKANNPVVDGYDPNKENEYLIYLDANNIYGCAMSQELPVGNFEWKDAIEHFDVMNVLDDSNKVYILEVDLPAVVVLFIYRVKACFVLLNIKYL